MIFNFNAAEVFKVGIKIEENGKAFYEKAQKVIDNPAIQKLFQDLAQEEVHHKKIFEDLMAKLPKQASQSTVWDPDNETDAYIKMMADQHVFVGGGSIESQVAQLKDVKDALRLAINFEKDSVIFFLSVQEATDEAKGQEFIGALVKEEQQHLRRLSLELKKLG
jgi:rubrerythrin